MPKNSGLLAHYLHRLEGEPILVHVGPKALPLKSILGERYRRMPPMPANEFAGLIAAADLVFIDQRFCDDEYGGGISGYTCSDCGAL